MALTKVTGDVIENNIVISGIVTASQVNVGTAVIISSTGINAPGIGLTIASINSGPLAGNRNRIINGDMRIDQRNAGVSSSIDGFVAYTLDRWSASDVTDGVFAVQRSGVVPVGFTSSLLVTTTTADASLAAAQYAHVFHHIEGHNCSDLEWGTSNAVPVTLSFWTRSSLTGTFGGAIRNVFANRSYPFSYSISAANTWEYKSITIPGDTTGTWLKNTNIGMTVLFGLGSGSTFAGPAGSWAATNYTNTTGETSVIGTLNATWYLTGVQLEPGPVATPFERRPYGTELALCQRYYQKSENLGGAGKRVYNNTGITAGMQVSVDFPVYMRTAPNLTVYGDVSDGAQLVLNGVNFTTTSGFTQYHNIANGQFLDFHYYIASAEF